MGVQRSRSRVRGGLSVVLAVAACGDSAGAVEIAGTTSGGSTSEASTSTTVGTTSASVGTDAVTTAASGEGSSGPALDVPPMDALEPGELRPGGDTTVDVASAGAFVQEAANLSLERRAAFEAGLQFFQLPWEVAPSTAEIDGLGPTFNALACVECHVRNGRALAPTEARGSPGILLRLADAQGAADPILGAQLQPRSIPGVPLEGTVSWALEPAGSVALRGGSVELQRIVPTIVPGELGPPSMDTLVSPRLSMQLVGQGLLEAIEAADLEAWADPDDADGDGISGRVAWLDGGAIGRFGWKATQPTVRGQVAAAFLGDLGITSPPYPDENCPSAQAACAAAPSGGSPELTEVRLNVTAAYVRLLGVPARRDGDADHVLRGKAVFHAVGCADCHRPSFTTGEASEPELEGQRIWPYSDLLLHDLGPGLAQGGPEGEASPSEWRTAPLWSLGLLETVNGGRRLLHDGRARTIAEAIVWHGGEAEASTAAYLALSLEDREVLHAFVESL